MANVLFFHGYGYTREKGSSTFNKLKELVPDIMLVEYDYHKPIEEFHRLEKLVRDYDNADTILVGQSLGGLFVNLLAERNLFDCVLINPAIFPHMTIQQRHPEIADSVVNAYELLGMNHRFEKTIGRTVFLGEDDTEVDPDKAFNIFSKIGDVRMLRDEGHRLNNLKPVADLINFKLNSLHG